MHTLNFATVALALLILVSIIQAPGESEHSQARNTQSTSSWTSPESISGLDAAFREVKGKGTPLHSDRVPRTTAKELLTYINDAYASRPIEGALEKAYLCLQLMRARPSETFSVVLKVLVEDKGLPIPIRTGAISALARIPHTREYLISRYQGNNATVATSAIRVLASEHREGGDRAFYNKLLASLSNRKIDGGEMWLAIRDFHFCIQIVDAVKQMRDPDDQICYLARITFLYPEALWAVDPARLPIPAFILNTLQRRHDKAPDQVEAVLHSVFRNTPERWQPHVVSILSHLSIKLDETEAKFDNRLPWTSLVELESNNCSLSAERNSSNPRNDKAVSLEKLLGVLLEAQRPLPELTFSARNLVSKDVTQRLGKLLSLPPEERDKSSWEETEILLRLMQGLPRPEYAPVLESVVSAVGIPESITVRAIQALGAVDSSAPGLLQLLESEKDNLRAEAIQALPQTMSKDDVGRFVSRLRAKGLDSGSNSAFKRSAHAVNEIEKDLLSRWEIAETQPSCAARVAFLMGSGFYRRKSYLDVDEASYAQYTLRELKKIHQNDPELFEDVARLLFSLEPWCPPYGIPLGYVALVYRDFGYELTDPKEALLPGFWQGVAAE